MVKNKNHNQDNNLSVINSCKQKLLVGNKNYGSSEGSVSNNRKKRFLWLEHQNKLKLLRSDQIIYQNQRSPSSSLISYETDY